MEKVIKKTKKEEPAKASGKEIAVILIRGQIGSKHDVKMTLRLLKLFNKFNCTFLKETPVVLGMLNKAKDYITWGLVSSEIKEKVMKRKCIKEKTFTLHPPVGGFERKGIKLPYKKGGVLGKRDSIDKLLNKMV